MATVTVIIFKPVTARMRGWTGDIGFAVSRLANLIAGAQIATAPAKTGRLKASIKVGRKGRELGGIAVSVGSAPGTKVPGYAMATEQGAHPHRIVARRAPKLVFFWPKVGRVVRFKAVNHPGMIGTHWAERGMEAGMAFWR